MVFPHSSHVWIWELDHKENWVPKNWYFWTVALEKNPESPLDCKEVQPVNPKRKQSWIFIGRTDAEAEAPVFGHLCEELVYWKRPWWGKSLKAGGEGDDRGWDGWVASLTRSTWVWVSSESWWWTGKSGVLQCKELDTTEWLNWTESNSRLFPGPIYWLCSTVYHFSCN